MIRIVIYFLDNDKKIIRVEDTEKDIKYGYSSIKDINKLEPTYRFFFINIENLSLYDTISYNVFEPFNSNKYKCAYKYYKCGKNGLWC